MFPVKSLMLHPLPGERTWLLLWVNLTSTALTFRTAPKLFVTGTELFVLTNVVLCFYLVSSVVSVVLKLGLSALTMSVGESLRVRNLIW